MAVNVIVKNDHKKIDYALKKYRKKLEKYGTLREFKNRQEFCKKSDKKRNLRKKAIYREHYEQHNKEL